MNISDITAEGFVNTDRLENILVHMINEKKDSEKGPLSYIDTRLFVKKFMDNYVKHFAKSISDCYLDTYKSIFSDIATGLNEDKVHNFEPKMYYDACNGLNKYKTEVFPNGDVLIERPEGIEIRRNSIDNPILGGIN